MASYKARTFRPVTELREEWVKKQTNLNQAINYLIEKELYENGTRNVCAVIPSYIDRSFFENNVQFTIVNNNSASSNDNIKLEVVAEPEEVNNSDNYVNDTSESLPVEENNTVSSVLHKDTTDTDIGGRYRTLDLDDSCFDD